MAEFARHPSRIFAIRRSSGVYVAFGAGGHAGAFYARQPLKFARTRELPVATFVRLPNMEDYAAGPVTEKLCTYRELFDGSLTLVDLARMNEWLEVKAENESRALAAAKAKKE